MVVDTLTPAPADQGGLRISLTFQPSRSAAGPDGGGLETSTCAWIDRPLTVQEPPQIHFAGSGSTPAASELHEPDRYWVFRAYNTGRGHLEAASHGPVISLRAEPGARSTEVTNASPVSSVLSWLPSPLRPRHLLLAFGLYVLVAWIPLNWMIGVRSAWKVLANRYPAVAPLRGPRIWCGWVLVGGSRYRNLVRLTAGESHLHGSVILPFRPGRPPFSVPWSEITVLRDMFPFPRFAVLRLTFARAPAVRFLVPTRVGEKVIAASEGRLRGDPSREYETESPAAAGPRDP